MEGIVGDSLETETVRTTEAVEQFNFCIARPWEGDSGSLKVYTHGSQVHFGCVGYAKECRDYVRERTGEDYQIYMVVPVPAQ